MKKNDLLQLDWISFTFKADDSQIIDTGLTDWDLFPQAFPEIVSDIDSRLEKHFSNSRFYDNVLVLCDNVRISYRVPDGKYSDWHKQGVLVEVPSHGIEWLCDCLCVSSVVDLLKCILGRGASICRIDLCFDDYDKVFSPKNLFSAFCAYDDDFNKYSSSEICMSTNFSSGDLRFSKQTGSDTFYLGSRKTGKLYRCYDKNAQSDGLINAIRHEFELHGDYCRDMVHHIISYGGVLHFSEYIQSWYVLREKRFTNKSDKSLNPIHSDFSMWLQKLVFSEELPTAITVPRYSYQEREKSLHSFGMSSAVCNAVRGLIYSMGASSYFDFVMENGCVKQEVIDFYRRPNIYWTDSAYNEFSMNTFNSDIHIAVSQPKYKF